MAIIEDKGKRALEANFAWSRARPRRKRICVKTSFGKLKNAALSRIVQFEWSMKI